MNVIKVFIEIWPKVKLFLLEEAPIITAITAIVAVFISGCLLYWTSKNFIASHRPYVWAATHAYLVKKDNTEIPVVDVNTLRKLCLNAPAEITKEEYSYIAVKENNSEDVIHKEGGSEEFIIYPADPKVSQECYTMDPSKLMSAINNPEIKKLIRKVRIDYKEVSTSRKYFFEGKWEYDSQGKTWRPIKLAGN